MLAAWSWSVAAADEVPAIRGSSVAVAGDCVLFAVPESYSHVVVLKDRQVLSRTKFEFKQGVLTIQDVDPGTFTIVAQDVEGQREIAKSFQVRAPAEDAIPLVLAALQEQAPAPTDDAEPAAGAEPEPAEESAPQAAGAAPAELERQLTELRQLPTFEADAQQFLADVEREKAAATGVIDFLTRLLTAAGERGRNWKRYIRDATAAVPDDAGVEDYQRAIQPLLDAAGPAPVDRPLLPLQPGVAPSPPPAAVPPAAQPAAAQPAATEPDLAGIPGVPTQEFNELFTTAVAQRVLTMVRDFDDAFPQTAEAIAKKFRQLAKNQTADSPAEILDFRRRIGVEFKNIVDDIGTDDVAIARNRWKAWYEETILLLYVLQFSPADRKTGTPGKYFTRLSDVPQYVPLLAADTVFDIENLEQQKQGIELVAKGLDKASQRDEQEQAQARASRAPGARGSSSSAAAAAAASGYSSAHWYHSLMHKKRCRCYTTHHPRHATSGNR